MKLIIRSNYKIAKRILFVLLGIILFSGAYSQNIIRPKIACPNNLWVNSYNGVLFFARTDIETVNSALPMQLQFYYNSSFASKNYGYGLGFSLGYEMRYTVDSQGIIIERGDGRSDLFTKYEDIYKPPAGVFDQLTRVKPGEYLLTSKDGTLYYFNDEKYGLVSKITDRNNNSLSFTYSNGKLTRIADDAGRTITLAYNQKGFLTKASASFSKGSYIYQYDSKGRLTNITDPMENTTSYSYNTKSGRLIGMLDAEGNKTDIYYNSDGGVNRVKTAVSDKVIRYEKNSSGTLAPSGGSGTSQSGFISAPGSSTYAFRTVIIDYTEPTDQYSYYLWDNKGRVIEKTGLCCGSQEKLQYDDDDNVIKRTDANGNIRTFTYDNGNMLSATDPEGYTENYTYEDRYNQVTSYQDKKGNIYRFSYDEKGNLLQITGPENYSMTYVYNNRGLPITITDANENVTSNEYSDAGLLLSQTDAAGNFRKFDYDTVGNLITSTDARNFATTYEYDNNNRLISFTDPLNNTTVFGYDKANNITRITDPLRRITYNTYDALGQLLTTTDAAGGKVEYVYNGKGKPVLIVNQLNDTTRITYDGNDRIINITNAAGETTSMDYDAKGNLAAIIQANGNIISYEYTVNDQVKEVWDQIGLIASYTYDANGNVLTQEDGEGRKDSYQYDALNRLIKSFDTLGNGESYTYDGNSNLLSYTNRNGDAEGYAYDALNRLLEATDALNNKTRYEYDEEGNLTKAIDAKNNATSYTYDALGRNTHISFANSTVTEYGYDAMGNVIRMKDRNGSEIKYSYNDLDRLIKALYPDNSNKQYNYDAIGRLIAASNQTGVIAFDYDKADRIIRETLNEKTTRYVYDIANGKRTLIYPGGKQVEEILNPRDQISQILEDGTLIAEMTHNKAGQLISRSYNNGITTAFDYNENGWLKQMGDGAIQDILFAYDKAGNILSATDRIKPEYSEQYVYDELQRLVQFNSGTIVGGTVPDPLKKIEYQYDALGNRTSVKENGVSTAYASNVVNEYTSVSGGMNMSPQYDRNGNMLFDQKHTYTYDYDNNLVKVDENAASYLYDALGRRIAKIVDGGRSNFYYAGDEIIEERNESDEIIATYIFGDDIDDILKMNRDNESFFYHKNHLGSVTAVTGGDGIVKESYRYDPFGGVSIFDVSGSPLESSQIGNSILFTGRWYDEETGTYYYRARTMQPQLGRFMQPDPLLYVDGMNYYSYVGNNPVIYVDPWGENRNRNRNTNNIYNAGKWKKIGSKIKNTPKVDFRDFFPSFNETLGRDLWKSASKYNPSGNFLKNVPWKGLGKALGIAGMINEARQLYDNKSSGCYREAAGNIGSIIGSLLGGLAGTAICGAGGPLAFVCGVGLSIAGGELGRFVAKELYDNPWLFFDTGPGAVAGRYPQELSLSITYSIFPSEMQTNIQNYVKQTENQSAYRSFLTQP